MSRNQEIEPDQIDKLIGANLKKFRLERRLTLVNVANGVGVTYQQIQKYESGDNRTTSSMLYNLGIFLNVNIGDFYDGVTTLIETGQVEVTMPDPKERNMLIMYRKIGKLNQHHVANIIRSLSDCYRGGDAPAGGGEVC